MVVLDSLKLIKSTVRNDLNFCSRNPGTRSCSLLFFLSPITMSLAPYSTTPHVQTFTPFQYTSWVVQCMLNNGDLPKCFTEFRKFSDKNICHYSKKARTCHLLCLRPGCYHSTSKTHGRARISKLSLIHASVIYQIL